MKGNDINTYAIYKNMLARSIHTYTEVKGKKKCKMLQRCSRSDTINSGWFQWYIIDSKEKKGK